MMGNRWYSVNSKSNNLKVNLLSVVASRLGPLSYLIYTIKIYKGSGTLLVRLIYKDAGTPTNECSPFKF